MKDKFTQGSIDIHLGDGNKVTYRSEAKKVMVVSPDGNAWIVKTTPDGYTLEEFCKYCEKIATELQTKVFPWSEKAPA